MRLVQEAHASARLRNLSCAAEDYEGGAPANTALEEMLEELEPEKIAEMGLTHAARTIPSIPLANATDKYTRQGLAMFLFEPANVRPSGRMPNMKQRTADAADITAYLMQPAATLPAPAAATAINVKLARGRQETVCRLGLCTMSFCDRYSEQDEAGEAVGGAAGLRGAQLC